MALLIGIILGENCLVEAKVAGSHLKQYVNFTIAASEGSDRLKAVASNVVD
jgi:hypothetical protein